MQRSRLTPLIAGNGQLFPDATVPRRRTGTAREKHATFDLPLPSLCATRDRVLKSANAVPLCKTLSVSGLSLSVFFFFAFSTYGLTVGKST
jgi:hypothetical protein